MIGHPVHVRRLAWLETGVIAAVRLLRINRHHHDFRLERLISAQAALSWTYRYSRTDAPFQRCKTASTPPAEQDLMEPQNSFSARKSNASSLTPSDSAGHDGGINNVRYRIQCMICHLHRIGAPHHDPHQHPSSTCSPVPRDALARRCRHACAGGRILPPAPRFPVSLVQPADHRLGINQS